MRTTIHTVGHGGLQSASESTDSTSGEDVTWAAPAGLTSLVSKQFSPWEHQASSLLTVGGPEEGPFLSRSIGNICIWAGPSGAEGGEDRGACRGHPIAQQCWDMSLGHACPGEQRGVGSLVLRWVFPALWSALMLWALLAAVPCPQGPVGPGSTAGTLYPLRCSQLDWDMGQMPTEWSGPESLKGWELLPQMKAKPSSYCSVPNPTNQLHIN